MGGGGQGKDQDVNESRFMAIFQDMARDAAGSENETVLRMSEEGLLLVVAHREGGNYSCQVMDHESQCVFMDHVYDAAKYEPSLLEPYTLSEVDAYEETHAVVIPPLLKHYLTKVSRESCCDLVRTLIDLVPPPSVSQFIHRNMSEELVEGSEAEMVQVSTLQYTRNKLVIIKGPGLGQMVNIDEEKRGAYAPLWMSVFLPSGSAERASPAVEV